MSTLLAKIVWYDYDPQVLIHAREARGFNQEKVAADNDVHLVTINRVEKKRAASYELVAKLCLYYNLPIESVIKEISPPENVQPSNKHFLRRTT